MANSFEEEQDAPDLETIANLAENLVYRLPGCSDLMVRKTLQEVYRDFCRRSCCLRTRRHFEMRPGQEVYPVGPEIGIVDAVTEVVIDGVRREENRDWKRMGGEVWVAKHLVPPPPPPPPDAEVDDSLPPPPPVFIDITAVEIPKIGSEDAPQWFIDKYGEVVCSGVLGKLMMMTKRAWSDPTQGQMENLRYENAVNEARIDLYNGSVGGSGALDWAVDNTVLL